MLKISVNRISGFASLLAATLILSLIYATPVVRANDDTQRNDAATHTAILAAVIPAPAMTASDDPKLDAQSKATNAAKVFREILGAPDKGIPKNLLDSAEGIGVFPGVLKAGFIVGGRGGSGLISRRVPGGWGAPAFFKMGGGSFGAQIGAEKVDFVLLFMNEGAIKSLLSDKFEVGGEASAAAGPVGRTAAASTTPTAGAGILTYSRARGLFAGLELKGAVITPDKDLNMAEYGMTARDILTGSTKKKVPGNVVIFPQTLSKYSRR